MIIKEQIDHGTMLSTVKELKGAIKDLPDDMVVYVYGDNLWSVYTVKVEPEAGEVLDHTEWASIGG